MLVPIKLLLYGSVNIIIIIIIILLFQNEISNNTHT